MDEALPQVIDAETVVSERPRDHKAELRLWLRLLTCTTLVEDEVRSRLRNRFDVTLPRFDLMAQLHKAPDGLTLSQLSGRMMVSNGNLTALVERLVEAGHIERRSSGSDRRVVNVVLTPAGSAAFARMAGQHEDWIAGFFEGLSETDIEHLMALLGKLKASTRAAIHQKGPKP
ncbi:MAG: MarR family transcriptional regulator [Beijerinckiaceae bacterium]|jgi:DNA-binding MarR family transcriptional regulator|nr:MarR family transcriptional regulator [Beijerinckiaceae bacterium]